MLYGIIVLRSCSRPAEKDKNDFAWIAKDAKIKWAFFLDRLIAEFDRVICIPAITKVAEV